MRLQCEEGSKGRWEAINHSVPAADEPIARTRAGAAPLDRVPAQRHDAKPSATQAAEAWFPSAYASVPSPRPLAPAPTASNRQALFARDGGHSPLYYRRAGYVPRAPARFD